MDAKLKALKALKVVDLKHILSTAAVAVPAKATKPDLIAKILASKPALDAYAKIYPPDDLLAPPEDVDWEVDQLDSAPSHKQPPAAAVAPASTTAPAPTPASPPPPAAAAADSAPAATSPPQAPASTEADEELEKRKRRAERFGIPLVEPRQKKPRTTATKPSVPAADNTVLEQRAARFDLKQSNTPATTGKKPSAPPAQAADPEEAERRRKRAERFGISNKA